LQNGPGGALNFEEKLGGAFNAAGRQLLSLLYNLPGLRVPGSEPYHTFARQKGGTHAAFLNFDHHDSGDDCDIGRHPGFRLKPISIGPARVFQRIHIFQPVFF